MALNGAVKSVSGTQLSNDISKAKVIAIMGMTGSGKSTFIQKLTNSKEVQVGNGLHSCTQKPQLVKFDYMGHEIVLIDTPGFDDTFRTDADVLQDVADVLMLTYSQNARLSGIIYLHRIIDPRITHGGMRNLQMFRKLCGPEPMRNVVLATTFWSQVDPEQAQIRLNDLQTDPDFWAEMIEEGAHVDRFDNHHESAARLVLGLVNREKVDLQIQLEMSVDGKTLEQTQAGEALHRDLLELQEKHAEEIQKLKKEMEDARDDQDRKLEQRLIREAMKHERELEILHLQQQRLGEDRRNEIRALEQQFTFQLRKLQLQKQEANGADTGENTAFSEGENGSTVENASVKPKPSWLSQKISTLKPESKPKPKLTNAEIAKKNAKRRKQMKIAGSSIGVIAAVGGCVLNPLAIPSAIDAFVQLANEAFSDDHTLDSEDPDFEHTEDGL